MDPDTKTTWLGILAAIMQYWGSVGFQLPTNRQGWASLAGSACLAALGWKAKGIPQ